MPGIVLSVAVDLRRDVVPMVARPEVSGLDRATDAEIDREPQQHRTLLPRDRRCAVAGAIVHHANVPRRRGLAYFFQHLREVPFLVPGRHDGQGAHGWCLSFLPQARHQGTSTTFPKFSRDCSRSCALRACANGTSMSTMELNSLAANPFSTSASSRLKSAVSSQSCPMFTPKIPLLSGKSCSGWNQGIFATVETIAIRFRFSPDTIALAPYIISFPTFARQRKLLRKVPTGSSATSAPRPPVMRFTSGSKSTFR